MLKEAIRLAEAGFSVIWLKNRSKAPVGKDWTELPTMSADELDDTYVPGRNIGVRLGEPSRIEGFYLQVIDMDVRDPEYADIAREKLAELLKLSDTDDIRDFPTVISGSGGESRHFYMLSERPYRSKKLWHSDRKIEGADGKMHWCAEIELFGTGKQVALPPSIHPDTGKPYRWERPFDPEKTMIPLVEPDLLDELTGENEEYDNYEDAEVLGLSVEEVEDILDELLDLGADRSDWRDVGMAVKFELGDEGWPIFDEWSKRHKGKYNRRENLNQWRSFGKGKGRPLTMRSMLAKISERRHQQIWDSMPDEFDDIEDDEVEEPEIDIADEFDDLPPREGKPERPKVKGVPRHLLKIPGKLGLAVDHYNATSTRTQPQFAVQTALALGSVVLARHFVTNLDNLTSLYLVNLGATGSGKEFGRKFLTKALTEAGLDKLMGPNKYASEAGIAGELAWKPRHVTVYDEFGKLLASTGRSSNTNLRDAQTLLISLFGLLDSVLLPTSYSTNGKSKEQIEAMRNMVVKRPAVTVLGLSTPETFFDALSQDDVANGFLNRLLVVNSREPRRVEQHRRWKEIPMALKKWMVKYGAPDSDEDFMAEESATEVDAPVEMLFSDRAMRRLDEIAQEVIDLMDAHEPMRLDGMFSRSMELAQRIALIVALSCQSKRIEVEHVDWAWDYVIFYTKEMVANTKSMLGSSPMARLAEHFAEKIVNEGEKGATPRDFKRWSPEFKNIDGRAYDELVFHLSTMHDIHLAPSKDGRGRPTKRFLHAKFIKSAKERNR